MPRPLPRNLERLYRVMSPEACAEMYGGHSFTVDGVEFVSAYVPDSRPDRFYIVKSPELLAMYRDFLDARRPARVFELGIAEGGSVAWMALTDHVRRLVAIDNDPNRLEALDDFVATRGLEEVVTTHYGVDQADAEALDRIVAEAFGGEGIDLVIDDASHDYRLTRASFEILLPKVRPGGWYLVEDWAQPLKWAGALAAAGRPDDLEADTSPPDPLTRFGLELAMLTCVAPGVIDRVELNHEFVAVRRGPEALDGTAIDLADLLAGDRITGLLGPSRTSG